MSELNPDFRDVLSLFNAEGVEYMVVGGYALAAHGLPRATGDIDLWIRVSAENAARTHRALLAFGAPADRFTEKDFESNDLILQIGIPPSRVDVITSIEERLVLEHDRVLSVEPFGGLILIDAPAITLPFLAGTSRDSSTAAASRPPLGMTISSRASA